VAEDLKVNRRARPVILFAALLIAVAGGWAGHRYGRAVWYPLYVKITGAKTVDEVTDGLRDTARRRLRARFDDAGVALPPQRVTLIGLKAEQRLEVWADAGDGWRFVHAYDVLAASGGPGPKLREGDRQVPEGFYRIAALNPNSAYHLSLKLDYPNKFDLARAAEEGRADPGSNIFIHGKAVSIGCLAVGDDAVEELFVLAAETGIDRIEVLIAPNDLRVGPTVTPAADRPAWLNPLYDRLTRAIKPFARDAAPRSAPSGPAG